MYQADVRKKLEVFTDEHILRYLILAVVYFLRPNRLTGVSRGF